MWSIASADFCQEITLGTEAPYPRDYSLAEAVVLLKLFGPQRSVRRMLGPGDHLCFMAKTATAVNAAIQCARMFTKFTRDSWTTYLSSALEDPRPVLQRISKSKAEVAVCPAPMVEDVGADPIREPVLRGLSSVPAPQFPDTEDRCPVFRCRYGCRTRTEV